MTSDINCRGTLFYQIKNTLLEKTESFKAFSVAIVFNYHDPLFDYGEKSVNQ